MIKASLLDIDKLTILSDAYPQYRDSSITLDVDVENTGEYI